MKNLFLLSIIVILAGCKSYSYIEQYRLVPIPSKLPKLSVITDQEIFNKAEWSKDRNSYTRSLGTSSNLHVVEQQFTSYILDELTNQRTAKKGYAVLRINHLDVRNKLTSLSLFAIITAGIAPLVGIPAGRYSVELDITVEIIDNDQHILDTYRGRGAQHAMIAMYYGYGEQEAKEKCLYEAIEQCLNEINEKIMKDHEYLEQALSNTDSIEK